MRGGVCAALFALRFGLPQTLLRIVDHIESSTEQRPPKLDMASLGGLADFRRILVVEHRRPTGKSFDMIKKKIKQCWGRREAGTVRSFVLVWENRQGVEKPDYYGFKSMTVPKGPWTI